MRAERDPNDRVVPAEHQRIGRYELTHRISSGGMGTVYLARAHGVAGFERVVAIKCCHPHLRDDRDFATMFLDEARLAARIHHPNVVATLDLGDDPILYLVMEYVEGDRLSGLVRAANERNEKIPPDVTLRLVIDALTGLEAAHALRDERGEPLNLVHRDVSPQNILIGTDGIARIADFGIAKAVAIAPSTHEGPLRGKIAYMAPEQIRRQPASRQSDVFAAGVVLWEALTGQRLYRGETDQETERLVLHSRPVPPSMVVSDCPKALDAIVLRALENDRAKRFATAGAFADALEDSGVRAASPRQVSRYLAGLLGQQIERRRAIVEQLVTSVSLVDSAPAFLEETEDSAESRTRIATSRVDVAAAEAVTEALPDDGPTPLLEDGLPIEGPTVVVADGASKVSPADVASPAVASGVDASEVEAPPRRRSALAPVLTGVVIVALGAVVGIAIAQSRRSSTASTHSVAPASSNAPRNDPPSHPTPTASPPVLGTNPSPVAPAPAVAAEEPRADASSSALPEPPSASRSPTRGARTSPRRAATSPSGSRNEFHPDDL